MPTNAEILMGIKARPIDNAPDSDLFAALLRDIHQSFSIDQLTADPGTLSRYAYGNPTVLSCVDLYASTSGRVPYKVEYENARSERRLRPFFQGFIGKLEQSFRQYLVHGAVLWHTPIGATVDSIVLPPARLDTKLNDLGKLQYLRVNSSPSREFSGKLLEEAFIFVNEGAMGDPYQARPIALSIADAINVNNACYMWLLSYLQKGASFGLLLTPKESKDKPSTIDPTKAKEIKKQFREVSGAKNAGDMMLLLNTALEAIQLGGNAREAQIVSILESTTIQITGAFKTPATIISAKGTQTYANQGEAQVAFYRNAIGPLLDKFYDAMSYHLTTLMGSGVKISVDEAKVPVLQDYLATRMQKWNSVNYLSVNDKRRYFGYEPLEDDEDANTFERVSNLPNAEDPPSEGDAPPSASPNPAPTPPSDE